MYIWVWLLCGLLVGALVWKSARTEWRAANDRTRRLASGAPESERAPSLEAHVARLGER